LTGYDPRCWAACPQPPSIAVEDASGNQLALDHVCDTDCETCAPSSCPTGWCVFGASPVKKLAWDGGYYATSTCGSGTECAKRVFAPPGKYKALFCTSPTVFTGSDGGKADCITLTSLICVTADFDFPSATPVTATLPQGF
jgi:hypothetical protein